MQNHLDITQLSRKFADLRAGAIFVRDQKYKIKLAFSIIANIHNLIDFIIWIAPGQYLSTPEYLKDIKKAAGRKMRRVYFFPIENFSVNDAKYLKFYEFVCKHKVVCIVDDSLTIKNTESGRTQRLFAMKYKFKYRMILSAMPLTQGLIDLYSQFHFLDSMSLNMTETQFRHNFLPWINSDFDVIKRWSSPKDEYELVKKIRPYILFCDFTHKADIIYHNYDFELIPLEAKAYREEKELFLKNREQVAFLQVVQRFQYLYTICKAKVDALVVLVDDILKKKRKSYYLYQILKRNPLFAGVGNI